MFKQAGRTGINGYFSLNLVHTAQQESNHDARALDDERYKVQL